MVESDMIEKKKINYKEIEVQKPIKADINQKLFEGCYYTQIEPAIQKVHLYNFYEVYFAVGNRPCYLFTNPETNLILGENRLFLTKILSSNIETFFTKKSSKNEVIPSPKIIDKIIKDAGLDIDDKLESEEKWNLTNQINNENSFPIFLQITPSIDKETLKKIIKMISLRQLIDDYIYEDCKKDETIVYSDLPKLITPGQKVNKKLMKFSDHDLQVTNTKTGKSILMRKICKERKYGSATGSRLLGYSSADKTFRGDISGLFKPICCDEINQKGYPQEFFEHLPIILEEGEDTIGKGCKTLFPETNSSFTFCTNVKRKEVEPYDLMLLFSDFLSKFVESPQKMGSRICMTLFGNDFNEVVENGNLDDEDVETNAIIVEAIMDRISIFFERIVEDALKKRWLTKPLEEYKKIIISLLDDSKPLQEVYDYWYGNTEGYRRIRFKALKHATIDYACEHQEDFILKGKFDIDKILELAEPHVQKICDYNIKSLRKMIISEKAISNYLLKRFDDIKRDYVKTLTALVCRWISENNEGLNYPIPLVQIGSCFGELKDEHKIGVYTNYGRLENKLPENLDRVNSEIRIFGFELMKTSDIILVKFNGNDILKLSEILYPIPQMGTTGTEGTMGTENQEVVPNEPTVPKVPVESMGSNIKENLIRRYSETVPLKCDFCGKIESVGEIQLGKKIKHFCNDNDCSSKAREELKGGNTK
jgi:hypothetical protein